MDAIHAIPPSPEASEVIKKTRYLSTYVDHMIVFIVYNFVFLKVSVRAR